MQRKLGFNLGTVSMIVGGILCGIKASGAGLATWSWWVVTAFVWGPFALWVLIMLGIGIVIAARQGADHAAEELFDDDDDDFTPEEHRRFKRWLEKYGNF